MSAVGNWLYHYFGISGSGSWYGFWSGAGSDLGEVAILGAVVGAYRKHACHVDRCFRMAKHPVDGTPYVVCRKHHPSVPTEGITPGHVRRAHRAARTPTRGGTP